MCSELRSAITGADGSMSGYAPPPLCNLDAHMSSKDMTTQSVKEGFNLMNSYVFMGQECKNRQ